MNAETKPGNLLPGLLAIVLWLVQFGLGLQAIYDLLQILSLIRVALGGNLADIQASTPVVVFLLALVMLVYIIWSTEYHIKRVGKPESWRLFGWTIAVELSIILLNYLLG
jgi:hypothetical protein